MSESQMRRDSDKINYDRCVGRNLNFAASEAYKLLRTNILFALPDEDKCRVIGVTSALPGEGKSTTSLNLAYMLAELGHKVLLIEADLRLPTISKRLGLLSSPGLSNLLVEIKNCKGGMQNSGIHEKLFVISSGDIPPNPSELLGSKRMKSVIDVMSESFSFIIIDLPPITEVSDALVASKLTNGMVMVVRQNYANRRAVTEAMRQLKYAEAKILGFVVTCAEDISKGSYKKYGKYGKYGKHGGYGYDTAAEISEHEAAKKEFKSLDEIQDREIKNSFDRRHRNND